MNENRKKINSYRTLLAFQKAECVYDITYYFINHFLDRTRDRTVDQMQQAARSGKQNIVEGYSDAEGSTDTEHKLTTVAKGSLEELKEDYRKKRTAAAYPKTSKTDGGMIDISEEEISEIAKAVLARLG